MNTKYNLDPKFVKCAGCPKPGWLRRKDRSIIIPLKGRNGEELCHKCACCYKCGKKEKWELYSRKNINDDWKLEKTENGDENFPMLNYFEKDEKNPSGGWHIAFCLDCADKGFVEEGRCLLGRHESSYQYWKVDGVKISSQRRKKHEWKFERFKQAQAQAQNYWNSLSSSEREKECERLVANMKLGKHQTLRGEEGECFMWVCDNSFWRIKNGKLISRKSHLVPILIADEYVEKMDSLSSDLLLREHQIEIVKKDVKDYSSSPNPVTPVNSPQLNPGKDKSSEVKNNVKTIKFENKESSSKNNSTIPVENSPNNETLIINLKSIETIILDGNNLVIEFNKNDKTASAIQTITAEQINNNQELQAVKNYCQKNNKTSLNKQELNNIFKDEFFSL